VEGWTTTAPAPRGPCWWGAPSTADVTIANTGSSTINNWSITWAWPGNQQITNARNATITASRSQVTAHNLSYNATTAAGANATFGFQATYSGTPCTRA
jgi:Cellulose binding domain